jgi:amino acid adenylation domain-containing protein
MDFPLQPLTGGETATFPRSKGVEGNGFTPWEGFVPFHLAEAEVDLGTRFREIVSVHSKSVALVDWDGSALTYQELLDRANRVASAVRACFRDDPGAPRIVAVISRADSWGIIAAIGSLLAGCAYFPIDPAWPDAQVDKLLAESKPGVILADASAAKRLRGSAWILFEISTLLSFRPDSDRTTAGPGDAAAIFATSGSTGDPKLVVLSHRAILFDIGRQRNDLFLGPQDRFDLLFSMAFSASLAPIFGALLHGAQIHLFHLNTGLASFPEWLEERQISVSTMSVSTLRSVFITPRRRFTGQALRLVSAGSEALLAPDVGAFLELFPERVALQNAMAATETRTYAQYFVIRGEQMGDVVPVGWPVSGKEVTLLNNGRPAPAGEITIRSRYLSSGYLNDPGLTARKFEFSPDGSVLYRTGDWGQWAPDGSLIFLGREDSQVKIRGYRVELLAVEAALLRAPGVANCAVIARTDPPGEARLVAYVAGLSGGREAVRSLRTTLEGALPGHMVPSTFVFLNALPLNSNGKVDRQRLPAPPKGPADAHSADMTPVEAELRKIWCRVLEIEGFSRDSTFLELGGDSLKTLQMQLYMQESFGNVCTAGRRLDFYLHASLAEAVSVIESESEPGCFGSALVPIAAGDNRPAVVFVPGLCGSYRPAEALARHLGSEWSVYGLDILHIVKEHPSYSLKQIVEAARRLIRSAIGDGVPLVLVGFCFGAPTAFEIARQEADSGAGMPLFCPIDALASWTSRSKWSIARNAIRNFPRWIAETDSPTKIARRALGGLERLWPRIRRAPFSREQGMGVRVLFLEQFARFPTATQELIRASYKAISEYVPDRYAGQVCFFRIKKCGLFEDPDPTLGWRSLSLEEVKVEGLSGEHHTCMRDPFVDGNMALIARRIKAFRSISNEFATQPGSPEQFRREFELQR